MVKPTAIVEEITVRIGDPFELDWHDVVLEQARVQTFDENAETHTDAYQLTVLRRGQ